MTRLRKVMLEELQRRNFSSETIRGYIGAVERFARYFGKPPDQLGPDHIRQWQAHLLHERKLAVGTVVDQVAGLRFFFRRALKRRFPPDSIPYPRYTHHRTTRSVEPGRSGAADRRGRQSAGARHPHGAVLDRHASQRTGPTCVCRTSIANGWSSTSVRARAARIAMCRLCPKLLETLREYWRWKKPKAWLVSR